MLRPVKLAIAAIFTGLTVSTVPVAAQPAGRVDSSNFGIATQDGVISSGLPDLNLDRRAFIEEVSQQSLNTTSIDYDTPADAASAQEFLVFKFDLSSLPLGANASAPGWFEFSAWATEGEGTKDEETFGRFQLFEITAGDASWTDRFETEEVENPSPVTWNSLGGTFVELTEVFEDNTGPPNTVTGNPFGELHEGKLVSNGGFDGANRLVNIPIATINRLISGESIGLALGSVVDESIPLIGDYDADRVIDGGDYLTWQREVGLAVTAGTRSDGDASGVIDGADLQVWSESFGVTSPRPRLGSTNFSMLTTENFLGPESAPTLSFDWSVGGAPTVPEANNLRAWFAVQAAAVALRQRFIARKLKQAIRAAD